MLVFLFDPAYVFYTETPFSSGSVEAELSYLGQLLSDPLKVLRAPGVEADGAAGVHLAERHLLWRGAVIGLDRRRVATSVCASETQLRRDFCRMKIFIICHLGIFNFPALRCHAVYHDVLKHQAKLPFGALMLFYAQV